MNSVARYVCTRSPQTFCTCAFLQIAVESIYNIRTVVALGLQEKFSEKYNESLAEPYK